MKTCRLCYGTLRLALEMRPMPPVERYVKTVTVQNRYPANVYWCETCHHVQLADVIPPEELFTEYQFHTGDEPVLTEHYRQYAAHLNPAFVVEIGSNDGTLLKFFRAKVLGVDPSDVAAASGVPVINEFFTEEVARKIKDEHGQPDLICANHVFAHADDLLGMIRGIKRLLAPDGTFIFEAAYVWDMLRGNYYDTIYHEHLSYHAVKPLAQALKRSGLHLVKLEHNDCKGGSIRGFVRHAGDLVIEEPDVTLGDFSGIKAAIRKARQKTENFAHAIGFGASASGVVTTYQLSLERRLRVVVDDNPRRHGMYSPEANFPVCAVEAVYDFNLPVIILATRYTDKILARHPRLLPHRAVDLR